MESTVSARPPPPADDIVVAVTLEYPPTGEAAVKAFAPSARLPLVTT